jgi:hypothetical protein
MMGVLALALLVAGCADVGVPKPGAPAHHREGGFANTNPAYAPPNRWVRITFFVSRVLSTTWILKHGEMRRW